MVLLCLPCLPLDEEKKVKIENENKIAFDLVGL